MKVLLGDLFDLLEKYSESGKIPANQLDFEKALLLEYYKLALPEDSENDSLAWKMRQFGGDMEIPYVVRFLFKKLRDRDFVDLNDVIGEYFASIGDEKAEKIPEIFSEIVKRSKNLIVCGEDIVDIAIRNGVEPGALIAELKGSGLISPSVGCGGFGKAKAPLYEINRFFAKFLEK